MSPGSAVSRAQLVAKGAGTREYGACTDDLWEPLNGCASDVHPFSSLTDRARRNPIRRAYCNCTAVQYYLMIRSARPLPSNVQSVLHICQATAVMPRPGGEITAWRLRLADNPVGFKAGRVREHASQAGRRSQSLPCSAKDALSAEADFNYRVSDHSHKPAALSPNPALHAPLRSCSGFG